MAAVCNVDESHGSRSEAHDHSHARSLDDLNDDRFQSNKTRKRSSLLRGFSSQDSDDIGHFGTNLDSKVAQALTRITTFVASCTWNDPYLSAFVFALGTLDTIHII